MSVKQVAEVITLHKPCAVYLVRASQLGLVYVYIADDFELRWAAHLRQSWWLGEVTVEEIDVYWMTSREDARQMEAAIINIAHPRYNTSDEAGAYRRYLIAAEHAADWPVRIVESYDATGDLVWAEGV